MAEATMTVRLQPVLRFVRICCPACECVQGAAIQHSENAPWPGYVHTCIFCEYVITESEWDEVGDDES